VVAVRPALARGTPSGLTWLSERKLLKEKALRKLLLLMGLAMLGAMLFASVALAVTRQCDGRPCIGTRHADTLTERRGNGVRDAIYGRGRGDILRAQEHKRDRDRLYGGRGRDRLNARDHDRRDYVRGGPGFDVCIADYSEEIGPGCERVRVDLVLVD
jgi:hypothetical protein